MNAFRARGRRFFETKVPALVEGEVVWRKRATGTVDRAVADAIDDMIAYLGPEKAQAWDVLEMVTAKPQRWPLAELYRRWSTVGAGQEDEDGEPKEVTPKQRLKEIRAQLRDVDLEPYVEQFYKVLARPGSGVAVDTAKHYRSAIRLFIPKSKLFIRSRLVPRELQVWLEEMDDVAPGTVRKRGIGMGRFTQWLVERHVLGADPMRDIALPAQGDPLTHYIETADVIRLGDSTAGQMRLYEYVLPGTALEVSTALGVRVRAVRVMDREIHAPGTKTETRNRVVRVADFAWDAVRELMKGKHPDSRLFDRIPDRWRAADAHRERVDALGAEGHRVFVEWEGQPKRYTLRDHRHTWAVRAVAGGWPIPAVAEQLGHSDGGVLVLKVYGRHRPKKEERDRYEAMASARDETQAAARKRQEEGNG